MAKREDAITVHKTEIVFFDQFENKHYRLSPEKIDKIVFRFYERKYFFGLKKELVETICFHVSDPDIPEELMVWEHLEENFLRFRGGLRTFAEENKITLEIFDEEGNPQK